MGGGGGGELSLRFSAFLLHGLFVCFTVMSESSLDDPGFMPPVPPVRPSSSESSVEAPGDWMLLRVLNMTRRGV